MIRCLKYRQALSFRLILPNFYKNYTEIKRQTIFFFLRSIFIFQKLKGGLSFAYQQTFNKCISTINIFVTTNKLSGEQHSTFGK